MIAAETRCCALSIFEHVIDHYGLLARIAQLRPKLVIFDGKFINAHDAMIQLVREDTDNDLNAVAQISGQCKRWPVSPL